MSDSKVFVLDLLADLGVLIRTSHDNNVKDVAVRFSSQLEFRKRYRPFCFSVLLSFSFDT